MGKVRGKGNSVLKARPLTFQSLSDFLAFFEGQIDKAHQWTWSLDTVVEQLERALCSECVSAEMVIGGDARFGLLLTSMLPVWLFDLLVAFNYGKQPVPKCMQNGS